MTEFANHVTMVAEATIGKKSFGGAAPPATKRHQDFPGLYRLMGQQPQKRLLALQYKGDSGMEKQEVEELWRSAYPGTASCQNWGLYLDQTLSYVAGVIHPLYGQPYAITGAMVSNYIKTGALEPSIRKNTVKEHLARLVVISLLKEVFTVPEICALFQVQKGDLSVGRSPTTISAPSLKTPCGRPFPHGQPLPMVATAETDQTVLVRAMVLATVNRLFVKRPPFL